MPGKRDEYVDKLKAKLDEWNADIDKLKNRAEDMAAAARKEYQEQLDGLQSRRQELERKLQGLSQSAEAAWEDMKTGVDRAADALGEAIKSARARFGGENPPGSK